MSTLEERAREWLVEYPKYLRIRDGEHMQQIAVALSDFARTELEQAAQVGDVARPRVQSKPRPRIVMPEEAYDAAMVDYSDLIRERAR